MTIWNKITESFRGITNITTWGKPDTGSGREPTICDLFPEIFAPPTMSGVNITPQNALEVTIVAACINVISEDVAKLPFPVYKRLKRGKLKERTHNVYYLLNNSINEGDVDAFSYRALVTADALRYGNGYLEIIRNKVGEPLDLNRIHPDLVKPFRNKAGRVYYDVQGGLSSIPARDMIHISASRDNTIEGVSPIKRGREAIALAKACELFAASFFGNGCNVGGWLVSPNSLDPAKQDELRQGLKRKHAGIGKSHEWGVLFGGLEPRPNPINNDQSQFLQTRQFQIQEICRLFRVPLTKVGEVLGIKFNNFEQQEQDYQTNCLGNWLVKWERQVNSKLLDEPYFAEHKIDAILRADIATRYNVYSIARQNGFNTINEVKDKENENPYDIPEADIPQLPFNMYTPGQEEGDNGPEIEAPELDLGAAMNVCNQVIDGSLTKEAAKLALELANPDIEKAKIGQLIDALEVKEGPKEPPIPPQMPPNEPEEGPEGQESSDNPDDSEDKPADPSETEAARKLVTELEARERLHFDRDVKRLLYKEGQAIRKAGKQLDSFHSIVSDFYGKHTCQLREALELYPMATEALEQMEGRKKRLLDLGSKVAADIEALQGEPERRKQIEPEWIDTLHKLFEEFYDARS